MQQQEEKEVRGEQEADSNARERREFEKEDTVKEREKREGEREEE